MVAPLAVDLFCGLGGWTEGLLAEGYRVVGFDNERHAYGDAQYPAQLVIQDVLTIHGSQFKDAALIVASPPCQEFSYMAMPWTKAKEKARLIRETHDEPRLTALFDACFRIQREAIDAAGHFIPLVVENVCGAQKWVGRARWHYGSFYLWGDVPALMPITRQRSMKSSIVSVRHLGCTNFHQSQERKATKNDGGSWFAIGSPGQKVTGQNPDGRKTTGHVNQRDGHSHTRHLTNQVEHDAVKGVGIGSVSWAQGKDQRHQNDPRNFYSKSRARKAASAHIAKIPLLLARHIARCWYPA